MLPNPDQLTEFRRRLGADLVLAGSILDYGKIRWQWMLAGMTADMTAESIALGLATAWHPIVIGANFGFELLTSTPLWFVAVPNQVFRLKSLHYLARHRTKPFKTFSVSTTLARIVHDGSSRNR